MTISILVDMNLSAEWVPLLDQAGWRSIHWSQVGDPRADDVTIMKWAKANQHVVMTHDLDFGTILALTQADGPSVIQVRGQSVLPERMGSIVVAAIRKYEAELAQGAIVVADPSRMRARLLPL